MLTPLFSEEITGQRPREPSHKSESPAPPSPRSGGRVG
jgi:hypothetical protein